MPTKFNLFESVLAMPSTYRLSQWVFYKPGKKRDYVTRTIAAKTGDRILDIGCGPATVLDYLPRVDYTGIDMNERCIAYAKQTYGERGRFICSSINSELDLPLSSFDIVVANALLHHLSDREAESVLSFVARVLKPGGRFVSLDGYYYPGQSPIAKTLLNLDRGKFVREKEDYLSLVSQHLSVSDVKTYDDMLRIPYDLVVISANKTEVI